MPEGAAVLHRRHAAHLAFHRWLGRSLDDAQVVEREDGIVALLTPGRPERSLVNAVLYEDAAALAVALPELDALYVGAGVAAWTVWVPPGDEDAAAALEAAGHVRDGTPPLMHAELDALDLEVPADVVWADPAPWRAVGDINDGAYGLPPDHFAAVMRGAPAEGALIAVARDGDAPASCAVAVVAEGNAGLFMVATLPTSRGRGLALACVRRVLATAREGGATTTTLEASPMGRPVYERMGYATLGTMSMWERRRG